MKRRTLWLSFLIGVPLLVCGGGVIAVDKALASTSLDSERKALRPHGIPMTIAGIREIEGQVPEKDNAAREYLDVFSRLDRRTNAAAQTLGNITSSGNSSPLTQVAALAAVVQLQPEIAELHAISRRPAVNFHRRWEKGISMPMDALLGLSHSAKILRDSARQKSLWGDEAGALEDIACLFRISRHARMEFGTYPLSTAIQIEKIGLDSLARTLSASRERSTFAGASRIVARLPVYEMGRVIGGEIVFYTAMMQVLTNPPPRPPPSGFCGTDGYPSDELLLACKFKSTRDSLHARLLLPLRLVCESVPKKPRSLVEVYEGLERVEVDPRLDDYAIGLIGDFSNEMYRFARPLREVDSKRKLLRRATAIALRNPIPGDAEIDPETKKPFAMKASGDGKRIYGFGRDEKDDGGKAYWEPREGGYDAVVIVSSSLR